MNDDYSQSGFQPASGKVPAPVESLDAEWARILAECGLADEARLPPRVMASPSAIQTGMDSEINWWRPDWSDARRHLGWRWVFLLPSLILVALLFIPLPVWGPFFAIEIKLLIFMIAVAVSLGGYVFRRAARARMEPFCIFCGYNLKGLPDHHRCPECGRPYTWRLIAEYRRDRQ